MTLVRAKNNLSVTIDREDKRKTKQNWCCILEALERKHFLEQQGVNNSIKFHREYWDFKFGDHIVIVYFPQNRKWRKLQAHWKGYGAYKCNKLYHVNISKLMVYCCFFLLSKSSVDERERGVTYSQKFKIY